MAYDSSERSASTISNASSVMAVAAVVLVATVYLSGRGIVPMAPRTSSGTLELTATAFERTTERDPDGLALYRGESDRMSLTVRIDGTPWRICLNDGAAVPSLVDTPTGGGRNPSATSGERCWQSAFFVPGEVGKPRLLDPTGRLLRTATATPLSRHHESRGSRPRRVTTVPASVSSLADGAEVLPVWVDCELLLSRVGATPIGTGQPLGAEGGL